MSDASYQNTIRILQQTVQSQGELIGQLREIIDNAEIQITKVYGVVIAEGYVVSWNS